MQIESRINADTERW